MALVRMRLVNSPVGFLAAATANINALPPAAVLAALVEAVDSDRG